MKRRNLISATAAVAAASVATVARAQSQALPTIRWRMPSSFPKALDTVYGNAQTLASTVSDLTEGRFTITPSAAGELVPPLQILDAVQNGTVECGHTAGFYYIGKEPALVFDTGVPFGMSPRQHTAWMLHGGGLELMRDVYAKFNVVQIPCGNTGAQMGGWFRKEIKTPADFNGLRIRAAGFLGHIYTKLGATPQQIPASDVYTALEKGTIDAVEWVGPADDEKLGLHKVAKYYYSPGVLERGASLCFIVGKQHWEALPPTYKAALEAACAEAGADMLAKYDATNVPALKRLVAGGAQLGAWTPQITEAMYKANEEVMKEQAAKNETFRKVHAHWSRFLADQVLWSSVNDGAAEQSMNAQARKR
ncbi:TRAP transporter substrate-binding protein DctP [Ramlibacter sp. AN1015]|uniref:TRAP transporter substrate-binding protein n=1 Tax=Ramlibacter sp. AN1015 TaxID=3133428 RepID=UPI0030BD5D98